jgi:hypothetical protein
MGRVKRKARSLMLAGTSPAPTAPRSKPAAWKRMYEAILSPQLETVRDAYLHVAEHVATHGPPLPSYLGDAQQILQVAVEVMRGRGSADELAWAREAAKQLRVSRRRSWQDIAEAVKAYAARVAGAPDSAGREIEAKRFLERLRAISPNARIDVEGLSNKVATVLLQWKPRKDERIHRRGTRKGVNASLTMHGVIADILMLTGLAHGETRKNLADKVKKRLRVK